MVLPAKEVPLSGANFGLSQDADGYEPFPFTQIFNSFKSFLSHKMTKTFTLLQSLRFSVLAFIIMVIFCWTAGSLQAQTPSDSWMMKKGEILYRPYL